MSLFSLSLLACMATVVVDSVKKAEALLKTADQTPSLKCVVVMDPLGDATFPQAKPLGVQIRGFQDLLVRIHCIMTL